MSQSNENIVQSENTKNSNNRQPERNPSVDTKADEINPEPTEVEPEDKWLIRECDLYYDEYKECTSFRGRFHQYFIFGDTVDCNQWKRDYDNCCKWTDNKDLRAVEALINSEKARRMERLQAHYRNDTWKKRDRPPLDWNKPLPEWMTKRHAESYLAVKAQELKGEGTGEKKDGLCIIM